MYIHIRIHIYMYTRICVCTYVRTCINKRKYGLVYPLWELGPGPYQI